MMLQPPRSTLSPYTTLFRASGTVGETFKDTAKLSGLFGAHAGGTVSFKLFDNKTCDASEGGLIASDGPVSVDGNGEYATPHGASRSEDRRVGKECRSRGGPDH